MELNQTTLRGILAAITSVDTKFIVPKQGNWWNPQDQLVRPDTWCAYLIRSNRPRTVPFYNQKNTTSGKVNDVAVLKIATIDLQFVGPKAEDIAQSVAFWPLRADVKAQFEKVQGAIMNDDMEAKSSNFYQAGNNSVIAWNVTIRVMWYHEIQTTQGRMPVLQLNSSN